MSSDSSIKHHVVDLNAPSSTNLTRFENTLGYREKDVAFILNEQLLWHCGQQFRRVCQTSIFVLFE